MTQAQSSQSSAGAGFLGFLWATVAGFWTWVVWPIIAFVARYFGIVSPLFLAAFIVFVTEQRSWAEWDPSGLLPQAEFLCTWFGVLYLYDAVQLASAGVPTANKALRVADYAVSVTVAIACAVMIALAWNHLHLMAKIAVISAFVVAFKDCTLHLWISFTVNSRTFPFGDGGHG